MNEPTTRPRHIAPLLVDRECGGWLAVTPDDAPFRIGVTAETEGEARSRFSATVTAWLETLASDRRRL